MARLTFAAALLVATLTTGGASFAASIGADVTASPAGAFASAASVGDNAPFRRVCEGRQCGWRCCT